MLKKASYNFLIALGAISQNNLRALLTSLGIIFGVASVITMVAIGKGAQQDILERMQILGVNNIIIQPVIEQEEGDIEEGNQEIIERKRFSPGFTLLDIEALEALPFVKAVSPEVEIESLVIREGRKRSGKLIGVRPEFFEDVNVTLSEGQFFTEAQIEGAYPVCVIGQGVKTRFFATEEPLGKRIKCGKLWLTVVGVLKGRNISSSIRDKLGIRNFDLDIYAPIETVLLRYKNRSMLTAMDIQRAASNNDDDQAKPDPNYHQLDKVVVQVQDNAYSRQLAEVISRMLERRHNGVVDFEITVPEQLLQAERDNRRTLNIALIAIALISLLVGGIGIMNIMLASVLERIKEIGLRLSIGATQKDIILQFLSEAVAISITGGLLGIFLGIALCYGFELFTKAQTIISWPSVAISFFVAVSVGVIFGIYPAQKAAKQDPVVSLRHE